MNLKLLAVAIAIAASTPTYAAFYVDEDLPQQTASAPAPLTASTAFDVGYGFRRSSLGPSARQALSDHLDAATEADQVIITGFGDAAGNATLAKQRAAAVKRWLVDNGVSPERIEVAEDTSARDPGGDRRNANKATITLRTPTRNAAAKARAQDIPLYHAETKLAASSQPAPAAAQAPTTVDPLAMQMVNKILTMAQNNLLRPEDAYRLIADILQPRQVVAAASPIQPAPQRGAIIVPVVEEPRAWTLQAGKTLKENLEAWAATAGWTLPTWQASNPYKITENYTLTGTFMSVLGQLAEMVPAIDLQVKKGVRTIKVVDAKG
ncbi:MULTISPECIES: TcpQ domain-containing protein [Ralstonia]|uniref:OmpA-like domain-containing protein n=2 Tax=Ralstonia TaxID=48736 RepID=A0AAD2BSU6_9RALS|nr:MULTISPECIES: TcpQ domain-containing protein [Ralstonia]NMV39908.1 OmpA family protein [Ralstonia insidiosa]CAJ0808642.1 hypothetical protein R77560_04757 [Ralstonia sp. LMG 18095]